MIGSGVTGPTIASQRKIKLASQHPGANKGGRRKPSFLLDTQLSSSRISANSTRHSVTSRIQRNSRPLSDLIFSTRHLNATPVKRNFVEKFNTFLHLIFAYLRSRKFRCGAESVHPKVSPAQTPAPKFAPKKFGPKKFRPKVLPASVLGRRTRRPDPTRAKYGTTAALA